MEKRGTMLGNEKGFTLIEIISVLVILGILAAVAIPRYIGLMDSARTAAAQAAISEGAAQVNNAAARYILINGTVPTTTQQLRDLAPNGLSDITSGDWQINFADEVTVGPTIYVPVSVLGLTGSVVGVTGGPTNVPLPGQ